MTRWMLCAAALTIALARAAMGTPIVANSGFEDPSEIADSAYTAPFNGSTFTVPDWTFGASENGCYDGLCAPGPAGSFTTLTGYEGSQVAFIEQLGTFSQEIEGFNAGTFTVSFLGGGRYYVGGGSYMPSVGANGIMVRLDETVLTFKMSDDTNATFVTPTDGVMTSYTSNAITIGAGPHTLTFMGTDTADHTSLIDSISLGGTSTIPEPSTIVLAVIGLVGLLGYAWRKR